MATILDRTAFMDKLNVAYMDLGLTTNTKSTRSYSGETFRVSAGVRLSVGTITTIPLNHAKARQQDALITKIQRPDVFFNLSPFQKGVVMVPASFKPGDNLTNVKTNGTQAVGYMLKLNGLPANYVLTQGDYLSFPINGVHRLYQVATNVTATSAGSVTVELNIPLRAGSLPPTGTVVTLNRPQMTCQYVDGSYSGMSIGPSSSAPISFSFQQVYRV